jgi:hypothetical protein
MTRRLLLVSTLVAAASAVHAQSPGAVLPDRLAPVARAAIQRVIDSARSVGLPISPLVDKAAEGVLKGADDQRIVRAVQSLARELEDSRTALGGANDLAVLSAAANALHAGVSADELRRLQRATSASGDVLASALVTLVDLVAKHVPVSSAANSIHELLRRRADDRQFAALRADVEQDIRLGQSPDAALRARMAIQLRTLEPASHDPAPRRPPIY